MSINNQFYALRYEVKSIKAYNSLKTISFKNLLAKFTLVFNVFIEFSTSFKFIILFYRFIFYAFIA